MAPMTVSSSAIGDELGRRDDAARGMTPAGERFHAHQLVGSRIELRLVIRDEFAALQAADDAVGGAAWS